MKKIEDNGFLYAQHVGPNDSQGVGKTAWFGKEIMPLQGSLMHYDAGKAFRTHLHIMNPRIINKTQECFSVARGRIRVTISIREVPKCDKIELKPVMKVDKNHAPYHELGSLEAGPGELIFVWGGYHKIEVLENDTIVYEIKAGQFNGVVSDDKVFLDE